MIFEKKKKKGGSGVNYHSLKVYGGENGYQERKEQEKGVSLAPMVMYARLQASPSNFMQRGRTKKKKKTTPPDQVLIPHCQCCPSAISPELGPKSRKQQASHEGIHTTHTLSLSVARPARRIL